MNVMASKSDGAALTWTLRALNLYDPVLADEFNNSATATANANANDGHANTIIRSSHGTYKDERVMVPTTCHDKDKDETMEAEDPTDTSSPS